MHGMTNNYSVKWMVNEISAVNTLIKKKNEIFLYKKIQMVAKSYMRKGFLIYEEMRKHLTIYEGAVSHI